MNIHLTLEFGHDNTKINIIMIITRIYIISSAAIEY